MKKLKEQSAGYESKEKKPGDVLSKTSLDAQVRSFLQRFEEQAVSLLEVFHRASFNDQELFESVKYLFEQEDAPGADDELGDLFADIDTGPETEQPAEGEEAAKTEKEMTDSGLGDSSDINIEPPDVNPKIDIEKYGQNVISLIETAKNKFDFENPIINMAIEHIKEQYGLETAKKLMTAFENMGYSFAVIDDEEEGTMQNVDDALDQGL
jgi:hypothetical protein